MAFSIIKNLNVNEFANELNEAQRDAVTSYQGPSLIVAGAGSGKTRVLSYRIAYMLKNGVQPSGILALTFTNKAANEMKERIALLIGQSYARKIRAGTFHSVFSRILRTESDAINYPYDYTIYDSLDSKNLIRSICKEMNLDEKIYKASEILSRISMAKNNLITPDIYSSSNEIQERDRSLQRPALAAIYSRYAVRCKRSGAMDFDDLLLTTNILFHNHPAILQKYRDIFNYILVDEYQDTNYSQYLIINKLAQVHKNICVIGDDAQSIYSFRGARLENILKFQTDYPEARLFKLERNYRSTQNIVEAANSVISKNKDQIRKKLYSKNLAGEKIKIIEAGSDKDEGVQISNMIKNIVCSRQIKYNDFAILYRTNAQSRIFEESMRRLNIPYKVYGGLSFFERKEIKDMLSYYRLVVNPADDESLKRIINYPLRGIGKTSILKIEWLAQQTGRTMWEIINDLNLIHKEFNKGIQQKLSGFRQLMEDYICRYKEMEAFDLAYTIASNSGVLKDLNNDKTPEGISRIENLQELLNGIKEFTENPENIVNTSLSAYLQTVALYTDADNDKDENKNKVLLMTIHSAKGLEFRNVFISGVEEELFPSFMSVNTQKELDEERRLFYVALTRAMENVFISYSLSRYKWGVLSYCKPSRFIKEIDREFLDFSMVPGLDPVIKPSYQNSLDHIRHKPREKALFNHNRFLKIDNISRNEPIAADDPSGIMVGMKVEHARFGKGKVISKEGMSPNVKATVFFKEHGQKQLLLKFARLKIIS